MLSIIRVLDRAREVWTPHIAAAAEHGFALVDEQIWNDAHAVAFLYRDDGIYLDIGVNVEKKPSRMAIPGFNGIQLYSFAGEPLEMILTNGSLRLPKSMLSGLFEAIERHFPIPPPPPLYIDEPRDVAAVIVRHEASCAGKNVRRPTNDALGQRWKWMEQLEC